jgi:hypothetical protein
MDKQKLLTVRLDRELWVFLKQKAMSRDSTMSAMIVQMIEKLKKSSDNKLDRD